MCEDDDDECTTPTPKAAARPADFSEGKSPFCVISASVNTSVPRTWCATAEEATEHAKNLLKNNYRKDRAPMDLYVVQAIKIVRVPTSVEVVDIKPSEAQ
jgi:hypothetical protein